MCVVANNNHLVIGLKQTLMVMKVAIIPIPQEVQALQSVVERFSGVGDAASNSEHSSASSLLRGIISKLIIKF